MTLDLKVTRRRLLGFFLPLIISAAALRWRMPIGDVDEPSDDGHSARSEDGADGFEYRNGWILRKADR